MRLKNKIFLWVFLTTAVPICGLTLYATIYSEQLYQRDVDREIGESLSNIESEIRRRLLLDRELLVGLAAVPPVKEFLPVLRSAAEGTTHPESSRRVGRLERFIEDFQAIIPSASSVKVLDIRGNVAVPAKLEQDFAQLESSPSAILPPGGSGLASILDPLPKDLLPGEIGYILTPWSGKDMGDLGPSPILDMVLALGEGDRTIGYLTSRVREGPIDRLLHVSPRLHRGKIFIAEIDSDSEGREGLVVYDDRSGAALGSGQVERDLLQRTQPDIYENVRKELFGFIDSRDGGVRTYYTQFLPYPDKFLAWIVAIEIDLKELGAPFQRVRVAILVVACIALLGSLLVTSIGARKIVTPVTLLAEKLTALARGERQLRVEVEGDDEIQHAGEAFNYMACSLEEAEQERDQAKAVMVQKAKLASLGQLAAGIGHEINNPLHNIITLTKLMDQSFPTSDKRFHDDVAAVHEEALRASRIVRAVLDFAREVPLKYTRFEVAPWLQETLALIEQEALSHEVTIKNEVMDALSLEGDPNLLKQMLINLLLNALQVSPKGSEVHLVISKVKGNLMIQIHDQGPGIPPDVQEHIFNPFFTTKAAGGGSGLGLSISLGIAERHGGELLVHNRLRGGVTATVQLPRAGTCSPVIRTKVG